MILKWILISLGVVVLAGATLVGLIWYVHRPLGPDSFIDESEHGRCFGLAKDYFARLHDDSKRLSNWYGEHTSQSLQERVPPGGRIFIADSSIMREGDEDPDDLVRSGKVVLLPSGMVFVLESSVAVTDSAASSLKRFAILIPPKTFPFGSKDRIFYHVPVVVSDEPSNWYDGSVLVPTACPKNES